MYGRQRGGNRENARDGFGDVIESLGDRRGVVQLSWRGGWISPAAAWVASATLLSLVTQPVFDFGCVESLRPTQRDGILSPAVEEPNDGLGFLRDHALARILPSPSSSRGRRTPAGRTYSITWSSAEFGLPTLVTKRLEFSISPDDSQHLAARPGPFSAVRRHPAV